MGLAPLLAVCCGYFMVILDVTIVNVAGARDRARPAVRRSTDLQWIVDGYTVAFAGLLLLGGALGDRWGHRRVFCLGVAVFTVSSLGCAVAGNATRAHGVPPARGLRRRPAGARLAGPAAAGLPHAVGPGAGLRAVGRDRGRGGHRGPARRRGADHHGGVALGLRHQPARRCAVPGAHDGHGRAVPARRRARHRPPRAGGRRGHRGRRDRRAQRGRPPGHRRARGHRRRARRGRGRGRARAARALRRPSPAAAADGAVAPGVAAAPPSASCSTSASTA